MSESETEKPEPKIVEYSAQLYEITVGDDSWVVLSNSYAEVADYVDLVFRLDNLPALKIQRLELVFRMVMDLVPENKSVMTPLYLAVVRDAETDTESKVLANSVRALLKTLNETDITSISLYSTRGVVLSDVKITGNV